MNIAAVVIIILLVLIAATGVAGYFVPVKFRTPSPPQPFQIPMTETTAEQKAKFTTLLTTLQNGPKAEIL